MLIPILPEEFAKAKKNSAARQCQALVRGKNAQGVFIHSLVFLCQMECTPNGMRKRYYLKSPKGMLPRTAKAFLEKCL